jgi:hypothetical protein
MPMIETSILVAPSGVFSNQIYPDFKKLYELKPILEEAGLFPLPIESNGQNFAQV